MSETDVKRAIESGGFESMWRAAEARCAELAEALGESSDNHAKTLMRCARLVDALRVAIQSLKQTASTTDVEELKDLANAAYEILDDALSDTGEPHPNNSYAVGSRHGAANVRAQIIAALEAYNDGNILVRKAIQIVRDVSSNDPWEGNWSESSNDPSGFGVNVIDSAEMRERAAQLCHEKAIGVGAVDGYDYRSGQEAAFREASILIRALPLTEGKAND